MKFIMILNKGMCMTNATEHPFPWFSSSYQNLLMLWSEPSDCMTNATEISVTSSSGIRGQKKGEPSFPHS